ncbi:hypothetical protein [Nocardioides sp. SYSU D00038]|uniref:hypothetical protein n=1 Tax=Nocardioides sp. SYSU D00038 TaxID=2812554 RepID=UPI001966ECE5|nr:hypothetical protein [Nocardioides sp. SYSU D00038]
MSSTNDDDAWRAIVENYGERAAIDPADDPAGAAAAEEPAPVWSSWDSGDAGGSGEIVDVPDRDLPDLDLPDPEDRFVPPTPPPLPRPPRDRLLAWVGLFGSPLVLLVCLLLGIDLPPIIGYALVGGFVGGFLYLVFRMPREPGDPFDDGARL